MTTGGPLPSSRQMHQSSGFAQPDVNAAVLSHAAFTDPRMAADIRRDDGRIAGAMHRGIPDQHRGLPSGPAALGAGHRTEPDHMRAATRAFCWMG